MLSQALVLLWEEHWFRDCQIQNFDDSLLSMADSAYGTRRQNFELISLPAEYGVMVRSRGVQ